MEIKPVTVVAILDYNLFKDDEYIRRLEIKNRGKAVSDFTKYIIIELPKFREKVPNLDDKLEQRLTYIDFRNLKGVEEAMRKNENIKGIHRKIEYLTGTEAKRRKIELKAKYESDLNSMKYASKEEGRAEGIEEGIVKGIEEGIVKGVAKGVAKGVKETTKKVVQNMINSNYPKEAIMQITGVSNEYIDSLMGTV